MARYQFAGVLHPTAAFDQGLGEVASDAPSAETQTQDTQALQALDRALSTLPDTLKTPLILTALDGLSTAEAAAVMGVSPKAVETRLYRARKALGAQMGAFFERA